VINKAHQRTKCCRSPWLDCDLTKDKLYGEVYVSKKENHKQHQGTFLHQARRAKVQERRQHETLGEIPCNGVWIIAQLISKSKFRRYL
jgi:hypothetical protein